MLVLRWIVCSYTLFFFKQKTAYEMRISDWSSDVCSSDLIGIPADLSSLAGIKMLVEAIGEREKALHILVNNAGTLVDAPVDEYPEEGWDQIGRASCRERVCQYV